MGGKKKRLEKLVFFPFLHPKKKKSIQHVQRDRREFRGGTTGGGGLCHASASSKPAALGASTTIARDFAATKPEDTESSKKLRSLS